MIRSDKERRALQARGDARKARTDLLTRQARARAMREAMPRTASDGLPGALFKAGPL